MATAIAVVFLAFLPALFQMVSASSHPREILVDDVVVPNGVKSVNLQYLSGGDDEVSDEGGLQCHMEYQVVKRVVGRCMKIGRNARGCVAGNYLHPFHPECI